MTVAPEPVLGIAPDTRIEIAGERRLRWLSRIALGLSIVGIFFALATVATLTLLGEHPTHHGTAPYSFVPFILIFALPCLGFALSGLVLGIGARRLKNGAAAVVLSGILVTIVIACLRKGASL